MLDSTAASPARKRQRTSLPGTLDEATTTQLAQRMAPKRFSSPSGSQRIPGSSQSQHGRQARLKAIADALANESISEVSPLISRRVISQPHFTGTPNILPLQPIAAVVTSEAHTPTFQRDIAHVVQTPPQADTLPGPSAHDQESSTPTHVQNTSSGASGFKKASAALSGDLKQEHRDRDTESHPEFSSTQDVAGLDELVSPSSSNPFSSFQGFQSAAAGASASSSTARFSSATSLPGFSLASARPNASIVPSDAAMAKAQKMLAQWDDDLDAVQPDVPAATETSFLGFSKASHKGVLLPSATALASAEKRRKLWEVEEAVFDEDGADPEDGVDVDDAMDSTIDAKAFNAIVPDLPLLATPSKGFVTPFALNRPSLPSGELLGTTAAIPIGSQAIRPYTPGSQGFATPRRSLASTVAMKSLNPGTPVFGTGSSGPGKTKAFRSPLLASTRARLDDVSASQSLGGRRPTHMQSMYSSSQTSPLLSGSQAIPPSTPKRASYHTSAYATPSQTNVVSTPRSTIKPLFSTPFRAGMGPGEPGRLRLEQERQQAQLHTRESGLQQTPLRVITNKKGKQKEHYRFFDLRSPPNRRTLATCGMRPQTYTEEELNRKAIDVTELNRMTPTLALYYTFDSSSHPSPAALTSTAPIIQWGSEQAFDELLRQGCSLATKAWVDNHWGLILWKLAGMLCLDPESEADPTTRRWTWAHVMKHLLYRYERELEGGSRPPLRLITTQDAPAGSPMVLCVSDITWPDGSDQDAGTRASVMPQLEVTDGWYRLRADVDDSMARAMHRGTLRVGMKILVAGARINVAKKDAVDILEAYDSCSLKLTGNSCHLAPWHAKLGYHFSPVVSGLGSLTADGGPVATMDLTIKKAFPVAFMEFIEDEHGNKRREGPHDEKTERKLEDAWKKQKTDKVAILREAMDKRIEQWQRRAERLEKKAGSHFSPGADDLAPDNLEDLYDELEETEDANALISRLSSNESGWLARCIHEKCEKEREGFTETVDKELKDVCPPREVRNFRVMLVEDSRPATRPAPSRAQLTVWDVLSISFSEGSMPGVFKDGQRFIVTNLAPSQPKAWQTRGPSSEIFLATRRDTRWRPIT